MKKYIPDLLAIFRIASSPVILFLILADGSSEGLMLIPAIIAFIAAWTDFFDGRLARKWNVSSKVGAFLDTIADKIFITFIFVGFMGYFFFYGLIPGFAWHLWNVFSYGSGALWMWWGDGAGRVLFEKGSGSAWVLSVNRLTLRLLMGSLF